MDFYKRLGLEKPKKTKKYTTDVSDIDVNVINTILRESEDCSKETKDKLIKLKNLIKTQGGKMVFSGGKKDSGIKEYGRKGHSAPLPMLWKKVKNTLVGHIWTDIDIENAQPSILKNICEKLEYRHPLLQKLCNKRDEILNTTIEQFKIKDTINYDKRSVAKQLYNSILFGSNVNMWIDGEMKDNIQNGDIDGDLYDFIKNFKKEVVDLSKRIYDENEFIQEFYERHNLKEEKENKYGSALSKVLQIEEDRILDLMIKYCEDNGLEIKCLEFDGLRVKNSSKINEDFLRQVEEYILKNSGYKLKLAIKTSDFKLFDVSEEIEKQQEKINGYEYELHSKYQVLFNDEEMIFDKDCLTEQGLMKTLLKLDDNFVWFENELYYFNGYYWKLDDTDNKISIRNSITKHLKPFLKSIFDIYNDYKKFMDTPDVSLCDIHYKIIEKTYYTITDDKKERPLIVQSQKLKTNNDIVWNENIHLLQFENCLYDTKQYQFIEIKKEYYINHSIGYEWKQDLVDETKKQKFIDLVKSCLYENVSEWFLCYLGSMIRKENKEQLCLVCTGVGGNGKSLLTDILELGLGKTLGKIPSSYFTEKDLKTGSANSSIIGLRNCYSAITDEIEVKQKFQLQRFKTLSSNGTIYTRGLYQKKEVAFSIGRVLLFCNSFMEFERIDEAIVRRIYNIIFPYLFRNVDKYDEKNPLHRKSDITLKNLFMSDEGYKMSVMSVLMDYCKKYDDRVKEDGFRPPKEIVDNTMDTIEDGCSVRRFNNDYIVKTDNDSDRKTLRELYDLYTYKTDEIKPVGKKEFNTLFQSLGYKYNAKYSGVRNVYTGLRIKTEKEEENDVSQNDTNDCENKIVDLEEVQELDYETDQELEYRG